jgi:hypothetical protein
LANAYEGLQRYQEAFDEMRETAALDPNNFDVRLKLGKLLSCRRRSSHPPHWAKPNDSPNKFSKKIRTTSKAHILLGSVCSRKTRNRKRSLS